jgi:hypothetical protein
VGIDLVPLEKSGDLPLWVLKPNQPVRLGEGLPGEILAGVEPFGFAAQSPARRPGRSQSVEVRFQETPALCDVRQILPSSLTFNFEFEFEQLSVLFLNLAVQVLDSASMRSLGLAHRLLELDAIKRIETPSQGLAIDTELDGEVAQTFASLDSTANASDLSVGQLLLRRHLDSLP